ncbi:MFS transporter [Dankookia rubra]|uniref:MFS transporter n=1 Tax=Dankookia rubra TaxID=1442381 RepID=A0A4V3A9F4_9PROT|nr:MFS transporter [Dankookia rubra]TDH59035.1 MFS transporter [Dankookia rubra]
MSGTTRFVAAIVAAQVLAQIGAFTLPALLPGYIHRWSLTATEAGWLIGAFFAAYVVAVPVLVSLTDRVATRRVYLVGTGLTVASHLGFALLADGFWTGLVLRAMAGIGWAGCYMPGLKAIADRLEGAAQSRAVTWHAAGVGIAGAASFAVAGGIEALAGPAAAFLFGGVAALAAGAIGAAVMPAEPPRRPAEAPPPGALLDFRPVFRNRAAMAWIAGYAVHTWELAALRAWAVTFLAATIDRHGAPAWLPGPTAIFTAAGLAGIAVSISGNETAQRFGRARVVAAAMGAAALLSLLVGWSGLVSAPLAALCVIAWNAAIYLDSSALTAGTVQAAAPGRRGATMGLHSMCGYAGGFLGPLGVGVALDLAGPGTLGWALGFGHLALVTLLGLAVLRRLGRAA